MSVNDDGTATAAVTSMIMENGEMKTEEKVFEGTVEEVEAAVESFKKGNVSVMIKKHKITSEEGSQD